MINTLGGSVVAIDSLQGCPKRAPHARTGDPILVSVTSTVAKSDPVENRGTSVAEKEARTKELSPTWDNAKTKGAGEQR